MFRVSLANLAAAGSFSGSTVATGYPAVNAGSPARPFQPWKTSGTGVQSLVVDFGVPTAVDAVTLIRTNFTSATIQGHASNVWSAPSYSQVVTVARNPVSSRYHHVHQIVGSFSYRYLRILISSQTPVDGADGYLLGGVWAGLWTFPPRAFRWGYHMERIEPLLDQRTLSHALHRLRLGEPIAHITAQRQARLRLSTTVPGLADDLAAWWELDRQMAEADVTLVWWEPGDSAQVWVMRRLAPPDWTMTAPMLADASLELEEILAGGGLP
jgi:hypothetical protein